MAVNEKEVTPSKKHQIIVLIIPNDQYMERIVDVAKEVAVDSQKICYVTLNRPYDSLIETLKSANVDTSKFFFVDGITKTAEAPPSIENCEFVSSPSALTELSLTTSDLLDSQKYDYIIFDSLSTLLVYESEIVVTKFIHFLMSKVRIVGCKAIFTCLKQDADSVLIKDLNMFADKIIEMEHWEHG